jgi:hypothetical protein
MKVDEDKAGVHLGEVSELDPGKTGALRLDLKTGIYLLYSIFRATTWRRQVCVRLDFPPTADLFLLARV